MTRVNIARFAGLLMAILSLAACKQDYAVSVTSQQGQVIFDVPKSDPYCLDRVTVYSASDRANPIWLIDTSTKGPCTTRVRYGSVPDGFEQRGPVAPLVPGKLYLVSVSRSGATGLNFFEPGREGSIEKEPPS
jgi:hypothetical protein